MKIKETRTVSGHGGVQQTQSRVRELAEGEKPDKDAVKVSDDIPVSDWETE